MFRFIPGLMRDGGGKKEGRKGRKTEEEEGKGKGKGKIKEKEKGGERRGERAGNSKSTLEPRKWLAYWRGHA